MGRRKSISPAITIRVHFGGGEKKKKRMKIKVDRKLDKLGPVLLVS